MVRSFFIRHGDNIGNELTENGRNESRTLHQLLINKGLDFDNVEAYSADNVQSMASLALVLLPTSTNGQVLETMDQLVKKGVIKLDSSLRYTKFKEGDEQIAGQFQEAYDAGETMKFYVEQSDGFLKDNPALSTFTTITHAMSKLLLPNNPNNKDRLFCTKQFLWPTFRASLFELKEGVSARDLYIKWYCSEKELKDESRLDIAVVKNNDGKYLLRDPYGEYEFEVGDLKKLLNKRGSGHDGRD